MTGGDIHGYPGMGTAERRFLALCPEVEPPPGLGRYVPARRYGDVITTSSISAKDGPSLRFLGTLGADLDLDAGRESARLATLNCMRAIHGELGSLDVVSHVVRVTGYVASAPDFHEQHLVIDAASQVILEIFGPDHGRHVRAAIGVASLPGRCSVGVEVTAALHSGAPLVSADQR